MCSASTLFAVAKKEIVAIFTINLFDNTACGVAGGDQYSLMIL